MRHLCLALRALPLLVLLALVPARPAQAQEPARLVADRMFMEGMSAIVAEGNVEVFYGEARLTAARVRYDNATGRLEIGGPIRLDDGGETVILADSAELDADLRNGIMRGARMVLDQQLQIAAAELNRVGGRYTQLYKTVASSCRVCAANPVPLWEIRSSRIVHDQQERQLYFDDAQLRVMGVPVLYLPRLRLPDPTLKRATGFLMPSVRSTSQLGFGVKVPYFIRLGDHRDLTLTPYLSSSTTTLELRYRQAFRRGDIEINGATTSDDIRPALSRGYLFARGAFELPRDYRLSFNVETTSDDAYLLDYGYSDKDRLDSSIALTRTRRDAFFNAELIHFKTLRESEDDDTIPSIVGGLSYHRRFEPGLIGGNADLMFNLDGYYRRSDTPGDDGRDALSASAVLDWRRDWVMNNGMVAGLLAEARLDYHDSRQGNPGEEDGFFHTLTAGAELRWPMARAGRGGVTHLIEPVVQVLAADSHQPGIANEDSVLLEFDEGNLFAFSRFPGDDAVERGYRANLGLTWTRHDPAGWSLGVTVGRIVRDQDLGQFTAGSGLSGTTSDWLAAVELDLTGRLTLANRALFDDALEFTRNETRLTWNGEKVRLGTSYVWMEAAPAEDRPRLSEWTFQSDFDIGRGWRALAGWRYDFTANRAARAGVGLEYETECVKVDLSLSRRFTSSTSVSPTTDFDLSVQLTGFGGARSGRNYVRRCSG